MNASDKLVTTVGVIDEKLPCDRSPREIEVLCRLLLMERTLNELCRFAGKSPLAEYVFRLRHLVNDILRAED